MNRSVATILAFLLLALSISSRAAAAPGPEDAPAKETPPPDPAAISAAIVKVKDAAPPARRKAAADLIALGPTALAEARKARDEAGDPEVKAALDRSVRWLLAAKMKPVLIQRYSSNLTFDGQYEDLKTEGPETAAALLALFDDEDTPPGLRFAASHALADVRDTSILPTIRRIEADPLLAFRLREEAATLMAILGDTSRMDVKIKELLPAAEKKLDPLAGGGRRPADREALGERLNLGYRKARANIDLSNLYYRIRQYPKAIACYDRAIENFEELRKLEIPGMVEELALAYYNAACSLSLNGDVDRAKEMLKKAVGVDPRHLKSMDKDGDLRNVRSAPGYAEFKRALEKPLEDKSI